MKMKFMYFKERWQIGALILIIVGLMALTAGCSQNPTPAVKATVSNWQVQRYLSFDKVWANFNSLSTLDPLDNTWRKVLVNGFVTTDPSGQGKMVNGSCTVYIFQGSSFGVTNETISTCPKGSGSSGCSNASTALLNSCGIKVVTLPATITFKGTTVTIVENQGLGSVVVFASDGTAVVTPTDDPKQEFEVAAPNAAYWASPDYQVEALKFFGFPAGQLVDFPTMVVPVENMGLTPQLQSANVILQEEQHPIIPINPTEPIGMYWYDMTRDYGPLADVIGQAVDWNPILDSSPFWANRLVFSDQKNWTDLRSYSFNPDAARKLLDASKLQAGQPLTIAFDQSIPGLAALAEAIKGSLEQNQLFFVKLVPLLPGEWDSTLEKEKETGNLVLVIARIGK
jgi:hypothetical protein